jgi:threonine/homoserine/homoserine lactone efflux protein
VILIGGLILIALCFAWLFLVMWIGARVDRRHVEREQMQRVFGERSR